MYGDSLSLDLLGKAYGIEVIVGLTAFVSQEQA